MKTKQKENISRDENKIEDIFEGEVIQVWGDDEFVSIAFPYCVVNIPRDAWADVKKDIEKLGEL